MSDQEQIDYERLLRAHIEAVIDNEGVDVADQTSSAIASLTEAERDELSRLGEEVRTSMIRRGKFVLR